MKKRANVNIELCAALLTTALLSACGGNDSGGNSGGGSYTISGTLTGLATGHQVTLLNNGEDTLVVKSDGNFTFGSAVAKNGSYTVTVHSQPAGQTCTAYNNSGLDVMSNVTDVKVTCAPNVITVPGGQTTSGALTVSGKLSGILSGEQVTLLDNMDSFHPLRLTSDGPFSFSDPISYGSAYSVTVANKPVGESCAVANGSANNVTTDVTNVAVSCRPSILTTLHTFAPNPFGYQPEAALISDNNGNFYGTTNNGGAYQSGVVFKVTNAGIYTVLYSFQGGTDGAFPESSLVFGSDGSLYGTTSLGGVNNYGTIFKITTSGKETVLYSFTNGNDGGYTNSSLIFDGSGNLYGTTSRGGANGKGNVFKLSPAGTLSNVYEFFGGKTDGATPNSTLVFDGNGNLCGTTQAGGSNNAGTVFKVNLAGTETYLYSFGSTEQDGATPAAGLIFDSGNGYLYGTTQLGGGANSNGTVFQIDPAGNESLLYSFQGSGVSDGANPVSGLLLGSDNNLYGTTYSGGNSSGAGTVFRLSLTGTETVLYSFVGIVYTQPATPATDAKYPNAALIQGNDGNLYGMTLAGGLNQNGAIFNVTPGGAETVVYSFAGATDGRRPDGKLVMDSKGNLYGATQYGGAFLGCGTVFKIASDGTETILHNFGQTSDDGCMLNEGLVMDGSGNLYGTTYNGGVGANGTVFKMTPDGIETVLHRFQASSTTDGAAPYSGLVLDSKGNLYGTTNFGGTNGSGTVFQIAPDGTESILYSFKGGADGSFPVATMVLDRSGNLYGATQYGGTQGNGTIFKLEITAYSVTKTVLYAFGGSPDAANPVNSLAIDSNGNIYGTTQTGGASSNGTVFKVTPNGTESVLYSFSGGADGGEPFGGIVIDTNGNLYGTTNYGGTSSSGVLFKLAPTGIETVLYNFTGGTDGAYPQGDLLLDGSGILYGATTGQQGTVFKF